MEFDTRIKYSKEKIFEDDEMILWRVSWYVFGEHSEQWIEEYKDRHP